MNSIQEGAEDLFKKHALEQGFKLLRDTGKHNIWKHKSGAQITSPKTSSDWRAIKNFKSELKYRLANAGVNINKPEVKKPIAEPVKPSSLGAPARAKFQSGEPVRSGTPVSFKDFMNKINAAKASASASAPTTSTPVRMARAYSNLLRDLPSAEKVRLGNKTLSQVTGLKYIPGSDRGVRTAD